ncbi:MAG: hypothetical protein K0S46_159 [Moraxellaceae bacterium]|jgi:hypothetical protein|nr:hypothetical protein [Moraxellaceae bacterium]
MRFGIALLLLVIATGVVGWNYRAELKARFMPPAPVAQRPGQQTDVLYSWVDSEGVTHFEQQPGKGQRVVYDGSRVTPLEPVQAPGLAAPVAEAAAEDLAKSGAKSLHSLRDELKAGAQRMQEAKAAAEY